MTLLFVSLLFLLSLLFEFCSPSLPFGWCCFCPPLVTAIGAGGFVNMLLFCCCCCCCCCEREREDVSHRESTKRDDTFSTERARTRKGVRGKEVLRRRRRRLPFVFKKSTNVFVFNPKQREEFVRKKKAKKKAQKKKLKRRLFSPTQASCCYCWCSLFGGFFDLRRKHHQQL